MSTVSLPEARERLATLVDAALHGHEVIIRDDRGGAVRLVAVAPVARPEFGSARGDIDVGADFDEPLDDFAPYGR